MQRKPLTAENAQIRLESLCARSEHCSYEIMTKLRGWGIAGNDAEKVLDSLIANRFVEDRRFAKSFVRDRYRFSGYGRRKIVIGLMAKRIPRDIIDEALEEIDDEIYFENVMHIVSRKAKDLNLNLFEERNKLYRHVISRGYESNIAAKAIKQYIASSREND